MKMFLPAFIALSLLLTMAAAQTTDETAAEETTSMRWKGNTLSAGPSLWGDEECGDLYSFANNILKTSLSEGINTKARNTMNAFGKNKRSFAPCSNLGISETRWVMTAGDKR